LLPLCGPAAPWTGWRESLRRLATSNAIRGALTMKAASHVVAAGVVAAVVGLGAWWTVGRRDPTPRASEELGPAREGRPARHAPSGRTKRARRSQRRARRS